MKTVLRNNSPAADLLCCFLPITHKLTIRQCFKSGKQYVFMSLESAHKQNLTKIDVGQVDIEKIVVIFCFILLAATPKFEFSTNEMVNICPQPKLY